MSETEQLAARLADRLTEQGMVLAVAESCTGGWLAKTLTDLPGSSRWFDRGFVTYSNAAKQDMLGVSAATLDAHGAVSEEVVVEMAQGVLEHSHADISVAISGIAGPDGGTPDKPVGTVCFAWALRAGACEAQTSHFQGDRAVVRLAAVMHAMRGVLDRIPDQ